MTFAIATVLMAMAVTKPTDKPPTAEQAMLILLANLDTPTHRTGCGSDIDWKRTLRHYVAGILTDDRWARKVTLTCTSSMPIKVKGKQEENWGCTLSTTPDADVEGAASLHFFLRKKDLRFYKQKMVCLP